MRLIALLAILGLLACSRSTPETESISKNWYRGNLHTHSFWSDGDEFPEPIMEWYKTHGYHFMALSDHNILADKEYWITMDDSLRRVVFDKYLKKYGEDWVSYKVDSGKTQVKLKTLAEYRPLFEEKDRFLIFQSEEITDKFEDKPLHLNATNLSQFIEPQGGTSVVDVLQRNINALYQQRDQTGEPMIIHINHPNFYFAITVDDFIALQGERFFELYNGHHMVYNLGDSVHISTETMWDQVNIAYLKQGKPPLFGLATDDSHNYHNIGRQWSNSGRGWIQVRSDSLSPAAIIKAMESGEFYASTGVELINIGLDNNILSVETVATNGPYHIQFIGCTDSDSETRVLYEKSGTTAAFELTPDLLFVRAKILSDQPQPNPVEGMKHQTAWTQPVVYQSY